MIREKPISRLRARLDKISPEALNYVEKCHALTERIYEVLEILGIDQKELAKRMGKHESEISKLLSGEHNMTYKTILKMQAVLGQDLIQIPAKMSKEENKSQKVFVSLAGMKEDSESSLGHSIGISCGHPQLKKKRKTINS